jgi:hypothetical protein
MAVEHLLPAMLVSGLTDNMQRHPPPFKNVSRPLRKVYFNFKILKHEKTMSKKSICAMYTDA